LRLFAWLARAERRLAEGSAGARWAATLKARAAALVDSVGPDSNMSQRSGYGQRWRFDR